MIHKKNLIALLLITAICSTLSMENPWLNPIITHEILGGYIERNPGLLGHDTICSLTLVNTYWNNRIKKQPQQEEDTLLCTSRNIMKYVDATRYCTHKQSGTQTAVLTHIGNINVKKRKQIISLVM